MMRIVGAANVGTVETASIAVGNAVILTTLLLASLAAFSYNVSLCLEWCLLNCVTWLESCW